MLWLSRSICIDFQLQYIDCQAALGTNSARVFPVSSPSTFAQYSSISESPSSNNETFGRTYTDGHRICPRAVYVRSCAQRSTAPEVGADATPQSRPSRYRSRSLSLASERPPAEDRACMHAPTSGRIPLTSSHHSSKTDRP